MTSWCNANDVFKERGVIFDTDCLFKPLGVHHLAPLVLLASAHVADDTLVDFSSAACSPSPSPSHFFAAFIPVRASLLRPVNGLSFCSGWVYKVQDDICGSCVVGTAILSLVTCMPQLHSSGR